jgi:hypothetical protein
MIVLFLLWLMFTVYVAVLLGPTGIATFILIVMFWHKVMPDKKE